MNDGMPFGTQLLCSTNELLYVETPLKTCLDVVTAPFPFFLKACYYSHFKMRSDQTCSEGEIQVRLGQITLKLLEHLNLHHANTHKKY